MKRIATLLALLFALPALAQTQAYPDGYLSPGSPSSGIGLGGTPLATTGTMNLFVATTGADSNACTSSGAPCLTIQGAVNRIPKWVRHPVTITVAAGTYSAGAYIEGFSFQQGQGGTTSGAYIEITGALTLSTDSPNSGTTTSAATLSGNNFPTLTPVSTGWALNSLRSKFLHINGGTGGSGNGETLAIYGNAAGANGVITEAGEWPTTPNGTSTWQILDPCNSGTIINGGLTVPLLAPSAGFAVGNNTPTANYSAFIVTNNTFTAGLPILARGSSISAKGGGIYLSNLCIQSFSGEGVTVRRSPGTIVRWSKMTALVPNTGCYISTDDWNTVVAYDYATGASLDNAQVCAEIGATNVGITLDGAVGDSMLAVGGATGAGGPFSPTGLVNLVTSANSYQNFHNQPAIQLDSCNDCSFAADKFETSTGGAGPSGYCVSIGCGIDANTLCRGSYSTGRIAGGFYNGCATGGLLLVGGYWNLRTTALTGTATAGPGIDVRRGAVVDNNAALATITGPSGDITADERANFFSWANLATYGRYTNLLTGATLINAAAGTGVASGTTTGVIQLPQIANASLPACGALYTGSMAWDTTNTCPSRCNGTTWNCITSGEKSADTPITFYSAQTTGSGLLHSITMTNAGTFRSANFVTDVTGVGAGNFVTKVCLDGASCAAGNTAWTCTTACTSAADTSTACTAGAATGWTAGATISWSIATACGTTNQIGGIDMGNTEP